MSCFRYKPTWLSPSSASQGDQKRVTCEQARHNADFKRFWRGGEWIRDTHGAGRLPYVECPPRRPIRAHLPREKDACRAPLSMYQSTIGELARKYLCGEMKLEKKINVEPPCNFCEIDPPCRGYYRKYECVPAGEDECVTYENGEKIYRNRIDRYWQPCLNDPEKHELYVRTFGYRRSKPMGRLKNSLDWRGGNI